MKKLIEKLGAFAVVMAMVLTMLPIHVQAAETKTWFEEGKSAVEGTDYDLVTDPAHADKITEIQVKTAKGLGFVSYLMSQKTITIGGKEYTCFSLKADSSGYENDGHATAAIKLMNDIDLAGKQWIGIGGIAAADISKIMEATFVATYNSANSNADDYFYKYSDSCVPFSGSFDGNGKTISNLTIQRTYTGVADGQDDLGFRNINEQATNNGAGGLMLGENYFMLNNESEFKNVTFTNVNVQIIDQFDKSKLKKQDTDDYYYGLRGTAAAFGLIMENHGTVSDVSVKGNVTILSSMPFYYGLVGLNRGAITGADMDVNVNLLVADNSGYRCYGLSTAGAKGDRRFSLISGIAFITGEMDSYRDKLTGVTSSSIKDSAVKGVYNIYNAQKDADGTVYPNYSTLDKYVEGSSLFKLENLTDDTSEEPLKNLLQTKHVGLVSAISGTGYKAAEVSNTIYQVQLAADESYTGTAGSLKGQDLSGLANADVSGMNMTYSAAAGSRAKLSASALSTARRTETFTSSVGGVVAASWKRLSDDAATNQIEIPIYLTTTGDISYRVEINWGAMEFIYDRGSYDTVSGETKPEAGNDLGWNGNDNVNNLINVANQSNASVNAKLNLQIGDSYTASFYKEAGEDKAGSSEKNYAGKSGYAAGTYLALSSAGSSSDNQDFYLVIGGRTPNGKMKKAQIGSVTVTITSQSASADSEKLMAYLTGDDATAYTLTADAEIGNLKLAKNKSIAAADNVTITLFGNFESAGHMMAISNDNTLGKLMLNPEFSVTGTAGIVLKSTKMLISGADTLKANGLVWTDSAQNRISDLSTDGLKGDEVKLLYLGSVADYLENNNGFTTSYPIYHSETMSAGAITGAQTLSLKNDAVLTVEGTFTGAGTLTIEAGSSGSVIYNGKTYTGAAEAVTIK